MFGAIRVRPGEYEDGGGKAAVAGDWKGVE